MGKSKRAVQIQADREDWPYKNGTNRAKRYIVSSLPQDIQLRIAGADAPRGGGRDLPFAPDPRPLIYNGIGVASMPAVGSPDLPDYKNRIALARADLVRHYTIAKEEAKKRGEKKTQAAALYIKGYNTGQLHPHLFDILGRLSVKTVEAWALKFKRANYDYTVLAPGWGTRSGVRKMTDTEYNMALSYLLHPNQLRISEVIRLTRMTLKKRGMPCQAGPATLRRALQEFKRNHYDQYVFCREGEKALNDKCLPYLERDISLLDVGDVLVADGHTLNFQILHPFTGKPVRLTLLTWYDWASCYPVGQEIMPTENIQCVAASLRKAIMCIGKVPKVAYLDNGRAFKAKCFTSTDIDFEEAGFYGMFARLGIETVFAWPYHGQSKTVERFFGTFAEMERLMPTYSGTSIEHKPAHMLRNEKLHKKIHEKKYGGWVPTAAEAMQMVNGWVADYAQRPHATLKGLCPGEVLEAGRGPGVDEAALRFLMLSMEVKTVNRNGIRFMGRNYYDDALYGYRDRVMIRYDLEDLDRVWVYDKTGNRLLCEAPALEPVHPIARLTGKPTDLAVVKEGIKQKQALKRGTESVARAYVEDAPRLVALPERGRRNAERGRQGTEQKVKRLARAEAERIESEAARMQVSEIKAEPDPVYVSDADRYEILLEKECAEQSMTVDDMAWMRWYEKTREYGMYKDRFEFLREFYLTQDVSRRDAEK